MGILYEINSAGGGSGGLLPILKIYSDTGSTVTCQRLISGGSPVSYPVVPITSGQWECEVDEYAVYEIISVKNGDTATQRQNVTEVKIYDVHDEHYSYAITVTFPINASCTCRDVGSTESYSADAAGSAAGQYTFVVHQANTLYTITATDGTKTKSIQVTSPNTSGQSSSETIRFKAEMYAFSTCTEQQLADMLESYYEGEYDSTDIATLKSTYMPIGAKRTVALSAMAATGVSESHHADNYDVVIIGHEHDDLKTTSSGGKTKAFLTLQTDRILYKNTTDSTYSSNYPAVADEGGYMEPTNTNVNGWKNCPRRTWCNDVFLAALPAAIQSLVKTVNKLTSAGNQSATIDTTEDKVFLLSEIEIFGAVTYSKAGEGSQYEYYTTASNIPKKPSYQSYVSAYVWERSPYASGAADFCIVASDGAASYSSASGAFGLAPAFCI